MAYLVLARKYRPQTFDDVVGQEHVTRTLTNAIEGGRVAHAMLFSGPRGTGKTTIARILAKAMNCETGTTATPCNQCRSCTDITAGRGADVFEIDGASNNSVDQVRELRENIRYMPAHSRYKIYIIDEVHMLSIAAFNALLKTLEEPPAHVLFFFATTEAHKIPVTILSRCQRHDLKRIELDAVAGHLATLCRQEGVTVSPDNLQAIARESGGSMRDSLSLLDQILACGDSQMDEGHVLRLLGNMERQVLVDLSAAVFAKDISRILGTIDQVYNSGMDLKRFYADLLAHFRQLMLIKMEVRPELLKELSATEIDLLAGQVADVSLAYIDQVFGLLFKAEVDVRQAAQPRLAIEIVFFKIHQITPALPIETLIERLDQVLANPGSQVSGQVVEKQSAYGGGNPLPPPVSPADHRPAPAPQQPVASPVEKAPVSAAQGPVAWQQILEEVSQTKPSVAGALSRAQLVSANDDAFVIALAGNDFSSNMVRKHLAMIESLCRERAGRALQIDYSGEGAEKEKRAASAKQKKQEIRQELLNHPLVADSVDVFSGKIEEIKVK